MDRKGLESYTLRTGFNLSQQEKDYFQHLLLLFIASKTTSLVFKGGTALQKAHGLQRFSEDIDFCERNENGHWMGVFEETAEWLENQGYRCEQIKELNPSGMFGRFLISGILFDGSSRSKCSVRFDVSLRKDLIMPAQAVVIKPIYSDMLSYVVPIMQSEEILAEKIRAIWERNQARDVYDLHFLLQKGTKLEPELIRQKMALHKEIPNWSDIRKKIKEQGKNWNSLDMLTKNKPAWGGVFSLIDSRLPKGKILPH